MTQHLPPSRTVYLHAQKVNHDRHLIGVFPAQYPREILWAMNALPVEIWDPPVEVRQANAHLQPYICSVVKLGLEFVLRGKGDHLDGFLFPHTCDSIQNLASVFHDYLGLNKPCYFFYHPKAPYGEASRAYYREQLKSLVLGLQRQLGPMDLSQLKHRVEQGQALAGVLRKLYAMRAMGELTASNAAFYQTVRLGEYLHPDDLLGFLEAFVDTSLGPARNGPAVVLSGVLPNPPEILTLFDELGVRVADDDLLSCGRRLPVPAGGFEDPFEALCESYFSMPPCTTRGSAVSERVDYLIEKIEKSRAKGVIFNVVKFCEPELFDVPQLVEALRKEGLVTLVIESELNRGLSGQLASRLEAFAEMIR